MGTRDLWFGGGEQGFAIEGLSNQASCDEPAADSGSITVHSFCVFWGAGTQGLKASRAPKKSAAVTRLVDVEHLLKASRTNSAYKRGFTQLRQVFGIRV